MRLMGLLATAVLVAAACGSGATTQPGAPSQPGATTAAVQTSAPGTQAAGGGGGSLVDKVRAVKHFCDLLPTDLIPGIIDVPTPPQEVQFPPTCSVFGTKTAMAIWFDGAVPLSGPPAGATPIAGLGTGAYLERLAAGNFTLYVGLDPEAGVLAVEVNNSDGKDHTDQAVNVARAVLQKLGG
jgi:hypothetical protein